MIKVCKPYLEKGETKTRCLCDLFFDSEKRTLWFEVDNKYSDYLCVERGDAYLIGLLHYAMENSQNLEFEVPITENLLYNVETILIPSVTKYAKSLSKISIKADTENPLMKGKYVGTGLSCGIDSFSAIYNHTNSNYPGLDITHVCINNVGAFNECYDHYGIEKTKEERFQKTKEVAKDLNLELIQTDSNYQEVIPVNHYRTHTYSSVFAIYMLQKFWKTYYYASSGYDYSHFNLIDNDKGGSAYYELLSLQCFSIPGLRLYSEGGEKSRFEKTRELVDYEPAQKHLHVCLTKPTNCNTCTKCKRTLVTLDLLGKLDNFSNVFNIDYYKNHKKKYYRWLIEQHFSHDVMNEPVYQLFKKKKFFKRIILFNTPFLFIKVLIKRITPDSLIVSVKKMLGK